MTYGQQGSASSTKDVRDVFVPEETARPEPHFCGYHHDRADTPEKRLMLAAISAQTRNGKIGCAASPKAF